VGKLAIAAADVDDLVAGVTLLGSGGGGDARTFGRVLRRRLGSEERRLHQPSELSTRVVVPVGVVGATSVFLEKLPGGHELTAAVAAVSRWLGTEVTAVMPLEAGGLNGVAALVAALELDLPFLDVDLMGRAFPRLDQLTWSTQGLPLVPCAICEPGGQVLLIDGATPTDLERTARSFLAHSGGWAAIALRPVPVMEAAVNAIQGSLARALRLGRAHSALPERPSSAVLERALGARVLGSGRVRAITRHDVDPTKSSIHVDDVSTGAVLRIEAQNEYLLAIVDGQPSAYTPDLICMLNARTSQPIAVDQLRPAADVTVVTMPSADWWRSGQRAEHVDPAAFGLEFDWPGRA
jgi:DUF917 family protein